MGFESVAAQLIANGLIAGAIYALVASGFSLIYSVNRFVHFAHGATIVLSAYFLFFLFAGLGVPFYLAALLTLAFAALFGYLSHRVLYTTLRKKNASSVILLLASLGLLFLAESVVLLLFGADVKAIGLIEVARGVDVFGATVTPLQMAIVTISIALLVILFYFMKKTKTGKAMRAVADNKEVAEIVGISSQKIYATSFLLGSAVAGVAAVLVALEQNATPLMGTHLMIKGFTAAVVGGITSVPGAVLGAFLLGLAENLGIWFLPSGYKDAIAFAILFIFLLFRPQGILGERGRDA